MAGNKRKDMKIAGNNKNDVVILSGGTDAKRFTFRGENYTQAQIVALLKASGWKNATTAKSGQADLGLTTGDALQGMSIRTFKRTLKWRQWDEFEEDHAAELLAGQKKMQKSSSSSSKKPARKTTMKKELAAEAEVMEEQEEMKKPATRRTRKKSTKPAKKKITRKPASSAGTKSAHIVVSGGPDRVRFAVGDTRLTQAQVIQFLNKSGFKNASASKNRQATLILIPDDVAVASDSTKKAAPLADTMHWSEFLSKHNLEEASMKYEM